MINAIPPGDQKMTHIIGRDQGYLGLAVNYSAAVDGPSGQQTPRMRTAWQPTPEELERLNAGASFVVELINVAQHPPIMVSVGEPPSDL